ncbi:MAG TPA: glycosyltransferase family 39 protein [Chloroflexia bacterium]|jgi:4-amino-4-deoxy-L-arabinose transferase-like glycosyltransferase|nr:glycosyltransferase family 39 protein [Chloroflexia bacterium]
MPGLTVKADRRGPVVVLAVILLLGGAARFWNLNWDQGAFTFYPDEAEYNRAALQLFPNLNPHFFNYGTFPIYLYRLTAAILHHLTGVDWTALERFALIGRAYSALASTLTILVVYAAGRRLWNAWAGVLAAGLLAGAALAIQSAHFGTVDTILTLEAALMLLVSLHLAADGGRRWYVLAGIILGLGLATKLTAASFLLMPLLAHLAHIRIADASGRFRRIAGPPALLLGCAAVTCLIAAPYYVLAWDEFRAMLTSVQAAASDPYRYSFNWQFIGTTPLLFEGRNLVVWALGVPLGLAAVGGYAWALVETVRRRSLPLLLLTLWPGLYLLYMSTYVGRFIRYLMPLLPFCCLCAAGGLLALAVGLRRHGAAGDWAARVVVGAVVLGAMGWGASFLSIYSQLDTRLAATRWIYDHVPRGSRWLMEGTYQQLPIPDAAHPADWYQRATLPVASAESPRKADVLARALAANSWLVIPDRRWSNVLPRLPDFPVARQFYARLFAGQLGYTEVARFANPPRLGPLVWWDDSAEETFQVFDHPTVRIFRNTGNLSVAQLSALLRTGDSELPGASLAPGVAASELARHVP